MKEVTKGWKPYTLVVPRYFDVFPGGFENVIEVACFSAVVVLVSLAFSLPIVFEAASLDCFISTKTSVECTGWSELNSLAVTSTD